MYDISLQRGVMASTRVIPVFSLMCPCTEQADNIACTCFTMPSFVVEGHLLLLITLCVCKTYTLKWSHISFVFVLTWHCACTALHGTMNVFFWVFWILNDRECTAQTNC